MSSGRRGSPLTGLMRRKDDARRSHRVSLSGYGAARSSAPLSTTFSGRAPTAIAVARTRPKATTGIHSTTPLSDGCFSTRWGRLGIGRTEQPSSTSCATLSKPVSARRCPEDAIVIVDGVFLLRGELESAWDFTVFVSVTPDETLRRALVRRCASFGSTEEVERRYRERYLPAQALYLTEVRPRDRAAVVVENEDPSRPVLRSSR